MKNFTKLIAILLAIVMVLSATAPTTTYALDWTADEGDNSGAIENNTGCIGTNTGVVTNNYGGIGCNLNVVENNFGNNPEEDDYINENCGAIYANYGYVEVNSATTDTPTLSPENWTQGIRNNETTATVRYNSGSIGYNRGTVGCNFGLVSDNRGIVTVNYGDSETLGIVNNNYGGCVVNNFGTVVSVRSEDAAVSSNRVPIVTNQYAGTVESDGNTPGSITNFFGGTLSGNISIINNFTDTIVSGVTDTLLLAANAENQYRAIDFVAPENATVSYSDDFVTKTFINPDETPGTTKHYIKTNDATTTGTITLTPDSGYRFLLTGETSGTISVPNTACALDYTLTQQGNEYSIEISNHAGNGCTLSPDMFGIYAVSNDTTPDVFVLYPSDDMTSLDTFDTWTEDTPLDCSGGFTDLTLCVLYGGAPLTDSQYDINVVSSTDSSAETLCTLGTLENVALTGTASEVATGASIKCIPAGLVNHVTSDTVYLKIDFDGNTYYRTLKVPYRAPKTEPESEPQKPSGSSGGATFDNTPSRTVINDDGIVTTITTTINADGSTTEITETKYSDGTTYKSTVTTTKDGTTSCEYITEYPDGSSLIVVQKIDKNGNGTESVTKTNVSGDAISVVQTNTSKKNGKIAYTTSRKSETRYVNPESIRYGDYKTDERSYNEEGVLTEKHTASQKTTEDSVTKKQYDKDENGKYSYTGTTYTDGSYEGTRTEVDFAENSRVETATERSADGSETTRISEAPYKTNSTANIQSAIKSVLYTVTGKNAVSVSGIESSSDTVIIPKEVTSAEGKTYRVTKLDKNTFDGKKIKELNLPDTVKTLMPKALAGTQLKTLNLSGKNTKLKKNCLKDTNKNLVITVTTKAEKKKIENQLKKAGNPNAKVKVAKKSSK